MYILLWGFGVSAAPYADRGGPRYPAHWLTHHPNPKSQTPRLSRVHASRRIMEFVVASGLTFPVIHHFVSPAVEKDQLILRAGSEVYIYVLYVCVCVSWWW